MSARNLIAAWLACGAVLTPGCGRSDGAPAPSAPAVEGVVASSAVVPAPRVGLGDGHDIVDLADSFIRYAKAAKGASGEERRALWDAMLEAQAPDFFTQVTYRKKEGAERERFKASVIEQFWNEVEPRLAALEAVHAIAVRRVLEGRKAFQAAFPDFDPRCDFYLTVAFSFKGKVVDVNGANLLALGLETLGPDGPALDLTIAHEQFHLHHFRSFSPSGGLYRGVWSEGLASYVAAVLVPNTKLSEVLGFDGASVDKMASLFDRLVADVLANMDSPDPSLKRAYLGMEPNDSWVPPGSGYYVGLMLAMELAKSHDLATMAGWDADTVHRNMKETLPTLTRE
ncbi:MAG: hypothetical protein U1F43_06560 [Myxococcota bacterium]